ncbi:Hypothetical protein DAL_24 [Psychrobacter phage D'Alembert]|nr:Hypothetical protein DAL_24 [Psychrobacter phage D'Alembert]
MNINHTNDLIFSVSYLKHNIENLNNLQKQSNDKMLVDPEYKETLVFKIKEQRIQQCVELHDLYVEFFNLGDNYKLENLLKEFEISE